jgi:tellurium resistance protein TerD
MISSTYHEKGFVQFTLNQYSGTPWRLGQDTCDASYWRHAVIKYTCRHCKAALETDDALGIKTEQCPACKKSNQVPPSKAQKIAEKERRKAALRQQKEKARRYTEQQRQEELAKRAETEHFKRERELESQRQYAVALQEAKADPAKPKIWYCSLRDGSQRGPMQEAILQKWIEYEQIGPKDEVRTENSTTWIRLEDIPERFAIPIHASNVIRCPRCGSSQISANKKGVDAGNACCGALLFGPLGLLCGMTDSNKVIVTCLNCGHQWRKG